MSNRRFLLLLQCLLNEGFALGSPDRTHPSSAKRDSFANVKFVRTTTTDHNAVVGNIFDRVMSDFIVAALSHKNTAGMPIKLANVMDVIVGDNVVFVFVFGPRSIA